MIRIPRQHRAALMLGVLLTVLASLTCVRSARAVETDLRMGVFFDASRIGLGAGVLGAMNHDWNFNPNLELVFGDHVNQVFMNGDFHYDFHHENGLTMWVGGGPALLFTNPEFGSSNTELGINLLTGVGGVSGSVRPYAQLKAILAGGSEVALAGGIHF